MFLNFFFISHLSYELQNNWKLTFPEMGSKAIMQAYGKVCGFGRIFKINTYVLNLEWYPCNIETNKFLQSLQRINESSA